MIHLKIDVKIILGSMKSSEFVLDCAHYKCNKINTNHGGSYVDSRDWIKNKKATINPINKKDKKCFQEAVRIILIMKNSKKIHKEQQKKKKYILLIWKISMWAYNLMVNSIVRSKYIFVESNKIEIMFLNYIFGFTFQSPFSKSYVSKHNSSCKEQVILLMIPNREKWPYVAVKKLSALLTGITFLHYGHFYCLSCLHFSKTKNKLESHINVSENKNFCNVHMPSEDTKILEFNQYQTINKAPFIICWNLEFLIEKIDECKNKPERSCTSKLTQHIPWGFSVSPVSFFKISMIYTEIKILLKNIGNI